MDHSINRTWLITWTTKGTWLPGDRRGWVSDEKSARSESPIRAPSEALEGWSRGKMKSDPVWLVPAQAERVLLSIKETAVFFDWWLGAAAIMANHVHVVVTVEGDPEPTVMLSKFKSYASRELNRNFGPTDWWTRSGSTRKLADIRAIQAAMRYVRDQEGVLASFLGEVQGLNDLDS